MKLSDTPNRRLVKITGEVKVPPGAPPLYVGDVIFFDHLDGMYSFCRYGDQTGPVCHLVAWAEVELL